MTRGGAAVLGVLAAFVVAGCGTGGIAKNGDASRGKTLFQQKCGGCHTLADAGTNGTSGPNLDDAFAAAHAQGYKQSTIEQVVADQIKLAVVRPPSNVMPANLVKGADVDAVAAYVAQFSGKGPSGGKLTSGKDIFTANCGSCHTLADARTHGTTGPNLDQLKPAFARVQRQVINGGAIMPAFKGTLSPAQIKAVAKYVSSVAGKH